jgi:hypothetical protein
VLASKICNMGCASSTDEKAAVEKSKQIEKNSERRWPASSKGYQIAVVG